MAAFGCVLYTHTHTYSSENPYLCSIFICFTTVLLPDSPAPTEEGERYDTHTHTHTHTHKPPPWEQTVQSIAVPQPQAHHLTSPYGPLGPNTATHTHPRKFISLHIGKTTKLACVGLIWNHNHSMLVCLLINNPLCLDFRALLGDY